VRRVSRFWNTIISKIGYCIEPSPPTYAGGFYTLDFALLIHPAVESFTITTSYGKDVGIKAGSDTQALRARQQEFLTCPPITTVVLNLETTNHYRGSNPSARTYRPPSSMLEHIGVLMERTGLRVGHLLDAFDKMQPGSGPPLHPSVESRSVQPIARLQLCGA
jgi:hypothetical protein